MKAIKINPQFDSLENPKTLLNHVQELTKTTATPHDKILNQLLEQFEPLDFEAMANTYNVKNFKVTRIHYYVLSIKNLLQVARDNHWDLCINYDFIYLFNGAYWSRLNKATTRNFLGKVAEKIKVPPFLAEEHKFCEDLYKQFLKSAYVDPKPSQVNKVLINLQNGTFEISSKGTQLRPFDRSDLLTYQLPFEYNPQAKAPLFEKYLNKVLPDKESQKVLAEYLGYVFIKHGSNGLKEEKALVLLGTGANGKSVFFEIVNTLLGTENTSNYSMQNLTDKNGYYRAKIANKLVNYASEINGEMEVSMFKRLSSGETLEARLPYGEPLLLTQYAKLIFNCNDLPRDVEHTNAYFRRFLIIPFNVTIPPEEQDKQLHVKIIEKELSSVFNWALGGLNRLLKQKGFTKCKAVEQAIEKYKTQSDSVKTFLNDNKYKKSPTDYELMTRLYPEYCIYCNEDGLKRVSKGNFKKRLLNFGVEVTRLNVGNVAYLSKEEPLL